MSPSASQEPGSHLILYDGVCALCNGMIAFVLPRDPKGQFHYAPLQSDLSRSILRQSGQNPGALNTFYIVKDYRSSSSRLLSRAQAVLFAARQIGGPWKLAAILDILPDALLDVVYDLVARHRYRIFGKYNTCPIPDPAYKNRFIGS